MAALATGTDRVPRMAHLDRGEGMSSFGRDIGQLLLAEMESTGGRASCLPTDTEVAQEVKQFKHQHALEIQRLRVSVSLVSGGVLASLQIRG